MSTSIWISICLCGLLCALLFRPLRFLLRFLCSAACGGALLWGCSLLGAEVGINLVTLLVCGFLGLPGAGGLLMLSVLL